jgi:hypothetical protein
MTNQITRDEINAARLVTEGAVTLTTRVQISAIIQMLVATTASQILSGTLRRQKLMEVVQMYANQVVAMAGGGDATVAQRFYKLMLVRTRKAIGEKVDPTEEQEAETGQAAAADKGKK